MLNTRVTKHLHRLILVLAVVSFMVIVLGNSDYVPLWDGYVYADCVVTALATRWQFDGYACAGHISHAYLFLLSLPGWFTPPAVWQLLWVNALLGIMAIASVYALCRALLPHERYRVESALLAFAAAMHPQMLAGAVLFNVDYGVCVFGLATAACLLWERRNLAALVGCCLVFSKETGTGVYAILVGCYLWLCVAQPAGSVGAWIRRRLPLAVLALPLFATAACLASPSKQPRLWDGLTAFQCLDQLINFRFLDPHSRAQWTAIFLLQFGWVTNGVLALGALRSLWDHRIGRTIAQSATIVARKLKALAWATALLTLALTRPQVYVNTRYFTLLYPLLLVLSLVAGTRLWPTPLWRRGAIVVTIGLLAVSAFRTIDPLSKRIYGTFAFGEHELLRMTSIPGECCGHGTDQLGYNLETVHFHEVVDTALRQYRPSAERPVFVTTGVAWKLVERVDRWTAGRTIQQRDSMPGPLWEMFGFPYLMPKPQEAYFLALPNVDAQGSLATLGQWYEVVEISRFGSGGYSMLGYRLRLRQR